MANGDENEQIVPRFDIPPILGGDVINDTGGLGRNVPRGLPSADEGVPPVTVDEGELVAPLASRLSEVGARTAPSASAVGGGAAKEIGSVSIEGTPPPDPRLEDALVQHRGADAQLEAAQNQAKALSLGIESQINESFSYGLQENYERTMGKVSQLLTDAETELAAVDDLIERARSSQVNPGQFFANVGEAGTFAAAIAVGAGAMAATITGGDNVAYNVISRAIDRNVRAQALNQQHDRAMISHQLNYVNGIRGLAGDHANIGNITRAALTGIAQAQLEQTRAAAGSQIYALNADRVIAQFGADMVDAAIKARQNIKFKYQMKFHNEAQADRRTAVAQAALENAIARSTGAPAAQQGRALPPSASPRQLGVGVEPQVGSAQASGAAGRAFEAATKSPDFSKLDVKEQAKSIARAYQEEASVSRAATDLPSQEEIDAVWKALDPTGEMPLANELRKLPDSAFTPLRSQPSVAVHAPGFGTRHLQIRDPKRWAGISATEQAKLQSTMGKKLAVEGMLREMYSMVGAMSRGEDRLGDLMRRGKDGELVFPLFAGGSDSELISRLNLVAERVANLKRTEVGPDAIRTPLEWVLWKKLAAGGEVTTRQQVVDILRGDPDVRQAKLKPYLDFESQDLLTIGVPYFTNFD